MRRALLAAILLRASTTAGFALKSRKSSTTTPSRRSRSLRTPSCLGTWSMSTWPDLRWLWVCRGDAQFDALLAGSLPPPFARLAHPRILRLLRGHGRGGGGLSGEQGVFFLRNKGVEDRELQLHATAAQIEAESRFWRTVILAGTVVNQNGTVEVPETLNAPFLAELRGVPFDGFVREVQAIGGLAAEPAVEEEPGGDATPAFSLPEPILILAGIGAGLLGAALIGRRLLARGPD